MATTLADLPADIIQTHIFHRLDAPSLSATTAASSYLHHLCSDDALWTHISNSTWPSTTHPRVADVINTFPSRHRSFFHDSFPAISTDLNHLNRSRSRSRSSSSHPLPSELISAVDIRYQNDVIYSNVQFTDVSSNFLSSPLRIVFKDDPTRTCNRSGSGSIDLEVDDIAGTDGATLTHLKEQVKLTWILIDPTRKRAVNLSSVKPVSVRMDWMFNDAVVKYVVVLPGLELNEMVQCKIQVVVGVREGVAGLHVKHVMLTMEDLNCRFLNGREFLVIATGALLEENNVRRRVVGGEERWKSCAVFKEMKRGKNKIKGGRMDGDKGEFVVKINYVFMLVSFCFSSFFLVLLLQ